MSIPSFLAGAYRYFSRAGVTNVAAITADLAVELVANGWTDEGGVGTGPFKSPVSIHDGSYMRIVLAVSSATRLQWQCYDCLGTLINNQTSSKQDIDAGGTTIHYFTGPDFCCVHSARTAPETFYVCRLNQYPHAEGDVRPTFVCQRGPRQDDGTLQQSVANWYGRLLDATAYAITRFNPCPQKPYTNTVTRVSLSGAYVTWPVEFVDPTLNMWWGRPPQLLLVDGAIAFGTELSVPIDVGLNGTVRVIGFTTALNMRMAIRKA